MPSSVYIDTDMLIFYYDKRDDRGRISRQSIKKVIANLVNPEIHVRIPQVVLGELLLYSCGKRKKRCELSDIITLLKSLGADYPTANFRILNCAQELMNDHIKPNDAVLVAHALLDLSTKWLLTTDQTLITNRTIKGKMNSMKHSFTIAPSFHLV